MILAVTTDPGVRLDDAENLRELAVDAAGLPERNVADALAATGAGELDGDHVWLEVDHLRSLGPGTPQWLAGFETMIAYAEQKGWTDGEHRVRAHVRWS